MDFLIKATFTAMQSLKSWLKVVLFTVLLGTLARILFFVMLSPEKLRILGPETPYAEILSSFVLGLRFDLSAICYLTLLFWLLSLFLPKATSLGVWKICLTFWSFLLLIDIGFYSFYNDRINVLMFGLIEDDTWALVKTFWKNYPVVPILILTALFYLFFNRLITRDFAINRAYPNSISTFKTRAVVLILLLLGGRGTFGLFPLGDHDTVVSSVPFLNTLSFGTAHAFSRAIKLRREQLRMGSSTWFANIKEFGYLNQEDQAFEHYFGKEIPVGANRYALMNFSTALNLKHAQPPHVVVIVMESWGNYGLQFQQPSFDLVGKMKAHLAKGLLNSQMLSTTGATTGSLSCLLAGVPHRTISPFLTESEYLQTRLSTSPAITFKKQGYQAHFIYGGNPGWRDINKFALAQGFDSVLGDVDITKTLSKFNRPVRQRHDWGVHDADVFNYVEILLSEAKTPQLIVVMTTTNHPPYDLPTDFEREVLDVNQFPQKNELFDLKLAQKRFMAFRYSSDALANFLTQLQANTSLQNRTITAVTADHTFWVRNFLSSEAFIKSAVPFFLSLPLEIQNQLTPKQQLNFKTSFASHHDIWPTLYDLSLRQTDFKTFGRSLFHNSEQSFALTYERLIFDATRAEYVSSAGAHSAFRHLGGLNYTPTSDLTSADQHLAQKYRALMAALDSYLYHSKMHP